MLYVHYVPVASDLANLSAAVQWVRTHPDDAAAIARRAGELVGRVLSTAALAEYAVAVLEGYAALDAANRPRQPEVEGGRHVRFACELRGGSFVDTIDGSANHALRVSTRMENSADSGSHNTGFRCARTIEKPKKRKQKQKKGNRKAKSRRTDL